MAMVVDDYCARQARRRADTLPFLTPDEHDRQKTQTTLADLEAATISAP